MGRSLSALLLVAAWSAPAALAAPPAPKLQVGALLTYAFDSYDGETTATCRVLERLEPAKKKGQTVVRIACDAAPELAAELAERGLWRTGCFALDGKGIRALPACPEGKPKKAKGAYEARWKAKGAKARDLPLGDGAIAASCKVEKGTSAEGLRYTETVCTARDLGVVRYLLEATEPGDDTGAAVVSDIRLSAFDPTAGCADVEAYVGTWRLKRWVTRPQPVSRREASRLVVTREGCSLRGALQGGVASTMEPSSTPFAGGYLLRGWQDAPLALWLKLEGGALSGVWSDDGKKFLITRRAGGAVGVRSEEGALVAAPPISVGGMCALDHCEPSSRADRKVTWTCGDGYAACVGGE